MLSNLVTPDTRHPNIYNAEYTQVSNNKHYFEKLYVKNLRGALVVTYNN